MRRFKWKIGRKIRLAFGIILMICATNGFYTLYVLNQSVDEANMEAARIDAQNELYKEFGEILRDQIHEMVRLKAGLDVDIAGFEIALDEDLGPARNSVDSLIALSDDPEQNAIIVNTLEAVDEMTAQFRRVLRKGVQLGDSTAIRAHLNSKEVVSIVEESGVLRYAINAAIDSNNDLSDQVEEGKQLSFELLETVILFLFALSTLVVIVVSIVLTRHITIPLRILHEKINRISIGQIPPLPKINSTDEIGEMGQGISSVIRSYEKLHHFAVEIEKGNLITEYQPSSEKDVIGHSLLSMRNSLKKAVEDASLVVSTAGTAGQLSTRIDLENKLGAWRNLSESVNHLLESIAVPLLDVSHVLHQLENGKLELYHNSKSSGDIKVMEGQLNNAILTLNEILSRIASNTSTMDTASVEMQTTTDEIHSNCREIVQTMEHISVGAGEQLSKLNQISDLVTQTSEQAHEVGEVLSQIQIAATKGTENCLKGNTLASRAEDAMNAIDASASATATSIEILGKRTSEIANVLSMMKEIATQTNLLALNAAIEASQAGEQGRGFSIIAGEIRKLAEESKKSVENIELFVTDVQSDTIQAVDQMSVMRKNVKQGLHTAKETTAAFDEILDSSNQTQVGAKDIIGSMKQFQKNFQQVRSFVESVVVISQESTAGTEQVASSSSELLAAIHQIKESSIRLTEDSGSLKALSMQFQLIEDLETETSEELVDSIYA